MIWYLFLIYKLTFHYLFDFKVILGPDINKLSDIYYRCEETWTKLNFIFLRFFERLNIITRTVCDTKRKDTTTAYLHIGYKKFFRKIWAISWKKKLNK